MNDFNKLSDIPEDMTPEQARLAGALVALHAMLPKVAHDLGLIITAAHESAVNPLLDKLSEYKLEVDRLKSFENWLAAQIKFETPSDPSRLTDYGRGSLYALHKCWTELLETKNNKEII